MPGLGRNQAHEPRVYFARIAAAQANSARAPRHAGTIKVGWSGNLADRARGLISHTGCDVAMLAWAPGWLDEEAAVHARLASDRAHGEFYHPTSAVLALITSVLATGALPSDLASGLHPLRRWRIRNELTAGKLGHRVRVSNTIVAAWEAGRSRPNAAHATQIERVTRGEVPRGTWGYAAMPTAEGA